MILSRLPERVPPLHPVKADQQVLERECQRMPHMKAAGHVWRRHHDCVGGCRGRRVAGEGAAGLPPFVPAIFDGIGIVGLGEFGF